MKKQTMGVYSAVRWMFRFIKPYKGWFILSVFAAGALISAELLKAYFIQEMVTSALASKISALFPLLAVFGLVILGGALFSYFTKYATGKFSAYAMRDLQDQLALHISKVKLRQLALVQSGDMASRLNNDTGLINSFMKEVLPNFTIQLLMGIGACICVFIISWKLFMISMLFIPCGMFLANFLNKNAGKYYPLSLQHLGEASGEVEQSLIGIEIIKAFSLQNIFSAKAREAYQKVFQSDMQAQKYVAILQPVCFALANFPRFVCIIYGGYMAVNGEIEIGTLIGVLQLFEYIIIPSVMLPFVLNRIRRATAAIERMVEVFAMPEERSDGELVQERDINPVVSFTNVSFGYEAGKQVLQGLHFELHHSQMTALVGASGSGKSTIINLLCALHDYEAGSIKLFGEDLQGLNLYSIRDKITVVSQDAYLFPATIAENIKYGCTNATMDEVIRAAQSAYAHEFIVNLPDGYNTLVGENGTNLSGGQRQRIAIARAFLKNAPILILDEPTSALDNYSETLIQQSLQNLTTGRTVLVIAHRLSTIIRADQILVLNDGHVVEKGTHCELFARQGLYYRLYSQQFSA